MQDLGTWILSNANAISGYVVLLVGVVVFVWALATNNLYFGKNVERLIAAKNAQIARCEEELHRYQFPKGGST